jgi:hypothetical protein
MLNHNLANKILNKYWKNNFNQVISQINNNIQYEISYNTSNLIVLNKSFFRYTFHYNGKYLEFVKYTVRHKKNKWNEYEYKYENPFEWWMRKKNREVTDNLSIKIIKCFKL